MSRRTQMARTAASMARARLRARACPGRCGFDDQAALADLDAVPGAEGDLRDPVAVHERAVRRPKVAEDEHAIAREKARVPPGDARVAQDQLALGRATDPDRRARDREDRKSTRL